MGKLSKLKKVSKRTLSMLMVALMTATCVDAGIVAANAASSSAVASSSSSILSNEERGVIFADSRTDFRDESIYFLITTRFYDGDPSNNARTSEDDNQAHNPPEDPSWRGDFKGLIDKLDYIKALGFTAIWITPVVQNKSGYDYHGYHAYNFSAVDTRYESNGITYQDLIDAVHAKGMKVIQDVVLNHTSNWGEENLLQINNPVYEGGRSEYMMPAGASKDPENIYHHNGYCSSGDFDGYEAQNRAMHGDCFDLETENPKVYNYLKDCYTKFINMGVDAFRIDTVKHMSRLTLNSVFIPAFKEAGGDDFYMFGEVCTKGHDVWYHSHPGISCAFYTWAEEGKWTNCWTNDLATNEALVESHFKDHDDINKQPTSTNAFLNGNDYHATDYSKHSGLDVIDFQMHWSFDNANNAFNMALQEDRYFNDSTWNVVYVDSHDYGPDRFQKKRYPEGTDSWAENMSLMFTFRGIPCIFYGTEIEFQKDKEIDVGASKPLSETGRAYYGDHIEGTIISNDFTVFGNVSGEVAETLNAPLSQHLMRLNRIRQAIPALRKGQYSIDGCSGNIAFKRRYTDSNTDSFALVAISGNATFSGIPNGKYIDAVTGDVQNVTGGTLTANVSGKGNMKVYVLDTEKTPAPGRVIPNGQYLTDGGSAQNIGPVEIEIVNPTGITLSKTSVTILEGNTEKVTATITPSNATNKNVSWSTSNSSVATVSGGTITAVAPGTATITAKTSNGITAEVSVKVNSNPDIIKPTGITVTPQSLTLTEGNTEKLAATVTPSNATNKTVTWTSNNTSVATIGSDGTVKAISAGSATITATTSNGLTAKAEITVEIKPIPIIENGVYFEKPSNWGSNINVYLFKNDQTVGASWPGTAMEDLGDGLYGYEYNGDTSGLMVIFNDGSNQTADLEYVKNGYYNQSGFVRVVDPEPVTSTVTVKYIDGKTNEVLSTQTLKGKVGDSYTTSAKTFSGYTLISTPSNASGVYTKSSITVTYIYNKNPQPVIPLKNSSSVSSKSVKAGTTITLTGTASGGITPYQYKYEYRKTTSSYYTTIKPYSTLKSASFTPSSTGYYKVKISVKDSAGNVAEKYFDITVTSSQALTAKCSISATTINLGTTLTINAGATGGTTPYQYKIEYKKPNTSTYTTLKAYGTKTSATYTPTSTGTYKFKISIKDSTGKIVEKYYDVTVKGSVPLTAKCSISSTNIKVNDVLTIDAGATGGKAPYKYKFEYKKSSASTYTMLSSYSDVSSVVFIPTSAGTYKFKVSIKDSTGKVVTKYYDVTVKSNTPLTAKCSVSATTINLGTTLTINAGATGGAAPYQYKIEYKKTNTSTYTTLKAYGTKTSATYTPTSTGTYKFKISIKDSTGKIAEKYYDVTVKGGSALTAKCSISATNVKVNDAIIIDAGATGGTAPYKYKFEYKKSSASTYTMLSSYSDVSSAVFIPTSAGAYKFKISVKDSIGKVVEKYYDVNVKA